MVCRAYLSCMTSTPHATLTTTEPPPLDVAAESYGERLSRQA